MGVAAQDGSVEGVQFHPESILTEHGHRCSRTFWEPHHDAARSVDQGNRAPRDLPEEMLTLMRSIMSGEVSPVLIAAIVTGCESRRKP